MGVKKPKAPSAPTHARDQARMDKGKEKVNEESIIAVRSYTTKGTEKKLLGDAVKASKQKHEYKKRQRRTTFVEHDIPDDQVVELKKKKRLIGRS